MELKKGQRITIYAYPLTKLKPEGEAVLLKRIRPDDGDGLETWLVEFVSEPGELYHRTISNRLAIKEEAAH